MKIETKSNKMSGVEEADVMFIFSKVKTTF